MTGDVLNVAIDVSAIPANPAGAGRYVVDLVDALALRSDVALSLFARHNDGERWPRGDRIETFATSPSSRPARIAYGELQLGAAVTKHSAASVLHGPHYTLPARLSIASLVTVHDLTLLQHPEWHERSKVRFFRRALRLASRRADVIVVPSASAGAAYSEHFGDARPVIVVPHGVDHGRFTPDEPHAGADREVLERRGIAWPYIVNIATQEPRKNLPNLVSAFTRIAPSYPELRLVLVGGSGWRADPLEAVVRESAERDRIVRTGYVSDAEVPALLRGAVAVAYPSFTEGFGLPALEALAVGAPLVTTARSAMSEVTGDAALLVAPRDLEGLAGALVALVEGGEEVERRRRQGIERASQYTWEASAAAHVEAYQLAVTHRLRRRSGAQA